MSLNAGKYNPAITDSGEPNWLASVAGDPVCHVTIVPAGGSVVVTCSVKSTVAIGQIFCFIIGEQGLITT